METSQVANTPVLSPDLLQECWFGSAQHIAPVSTARGSPTALGFVSSGVVIWICRLSAFVTGRLLVDSPCVIPRFGLLDPTLL